MSSGTRECIHILGAGGHSVFVQLSALYFLLDDCVCWLFEQYVWESKKCLILCSATCEINKNFWKKKIAPNLQPLDMLRKDSFLQHRQWKQTSKEPAAPVQTGR